MSEINALRISHKWAEIDDLGPLCAEDPVDIHRYLQNELGVEGSYVLQTCNRAEFYASGDEAAEALEALRKELGIPDRLARFDGHTESLNHLMRLACGLESMVIGENEILGQMRDSFNNATEDGFIDPVLEKALLKALHVGEKARSETAINEGAASMGSAAVRKARSVLGSLGDVEVIVVGAGDMGELVARSLVGRDEEFGSIYVSNRTFERAQHLAEEIGGEPIRFSELGVYLDEVDIVITATDAPHLIFDESDLRGRELLVLDMANPRDVSSDAADIPGVELLDIDDLEDISDSHLETRREAAERIEEMIEEEMAVLKEQYKVERAQEMLSRMYARAEEIRVEERDRAINRLEETGELDEDTRLVIDDLTQALIAKLMSTPTEALKKAAVMEDYDTLRSASEIFKLQIDEDGVEADGGEE